MSDWQDLDIEEWHGILTQVGLNRYGKKSIRFVQKIPGGLGFLTYTLEVPEDVLLSIVRQLGYYVPPPRPEPEEKTETSDD